MRNTSKLEADELQQEKTTPSAYLSTIADHIHPFNDHSVPYLLTAVSSRMHAMSESSNHFKLV